MNTRRQPRLTFPDPNFAGPDGLLAVGGDLAPETLITAYSQGIFPWYNDGQSILWWSPDPRTVLKPGAIHISRSLRKRIRNGGFRVTCNQAFAEVVRACAEERERHEGTWITGEMELAYKRLNQIGVAHSIETWHENSLVGGLYGVSLGRMFFGESMYSRRRDASKVALVKLCRHLDKNGYPLIDCQVSSEHILSMGATTIPRGEFLDIVRKETAEPSSPDIWEADELTLTIGDEQR